MTNDEVLHFVRERLNREEKISKICEEVSCQQTSQSYLIVFISRVIQICYCRDSCMLYFF